MLKREAHKKQMEVLPTRGFRDLMFENRGVKKI